MPLGYQIISHVTRESDFGHNAKFTKNTDSADPGGTNAKENEFIWFLNQSPRLAGHCDSPEAGNGLDGLEFESRYVAKLGRWSVQRICMVGRRCRPH